MWNQTTVNMIPEQKLFLIVEELFLLKWWLTVIASTILNILYKVNANNSLSKENRKNIVYSYRHWQNNQRTRNYITKIHTGFKEI